MPALGRIGNSAARRVLSGMMLAAGLLFDPHLARGDELDRVREQALVLLNQSRKEHNLPPLVLEAKLSRAAQSHANDMLEAEIFRPLFSRRQNGRRSV